MGSSDRFKVQHQEIQRQIQALLGVLDAGKLAKNSKEARSILSNLSGKLSIHLGIEDDILYPDMLNSAEPQAREKAQAYQSEVGSLKATFSSYSLKWNEVTISANPVAFISETKAIISALAKRIQREEADLYILLDAIGGVS